MGPSWDDHGLSNPGEAFRRTFPGGLPTHFSRAPGRVNLIGEHTDYNGLPVLPMALRQEIRVLFSPRNDSTVRVANWEREFGLREFSISNHIPPDPPGDWANYLKASCQALSLRFGPLNGLDALVTSNLPVASGLSSSSALVIAMGRAILKVNGLTLPTLEFAEAMARAERYTGTQGGGMDQAISAGAREGHASRIEFNPLRIFETPVPPDWRFVVAHTLVRAEKSGPAQEAYNRRTRECEEALGIIRVALGDADWVKEGVFSYRQLWDRLCIQELVELGEGHLTGTLLMRFRHVVTEAARVYDAEQALRQEDRLTFGLLMNSSHESLRDDYEVSSRELDTLVELALECGAVGARLTGAGFGGCMVALTDPDSLGGVMEGLEEGYYRDREVLPAFGQPLFVADASEGASVREL
jgi:galactokinase